MSINAKKLLTILIMFIVVLLMFIIPEMSNKNNLSNELANNEQNTKLEIKTGVIKNVWIESSTKNEITVFILGEEKKLKCNLENTIENKIADITIKDNMVTEIILKTYIINDKILSINDNQVELERYKKLEFNDDLRIYKIYNNVEMATISDIVVGYKNVDFVIEDGKVAAMLITERLKDENIRVVLNTTNYTSLYHNEVVFTANSEFKVTYGNNKEKTYNKGEIITIDVNNKKLKQGRIKITTNNENAKIQILSIERQNKNPSYRGSIELDLQEKGIIIVNELSLEEYLYAVVPSEMPTSYGIEALKVQAICARSFAYKQLNDSSYNLYGANLDDSVSSQVYNNVSENEISIQAVNETYGKVMFYDGDVVTAFFFSTSYGYTSDFEDVWGGDNTPEYLIGKLQADSDDKLDLSTDKAFLEFLDNNKYNTYEKDFEWYRWNVKINYVDIKNYIDINIDEKISKNSGLILVKNKKGEFVKKKIGTIGNIKDIQIVKRGKSGIVKEIIISGTKETIKIKTEYVIREFLTTKNSTIIRQDDSKVNNWNMLPSGYFSLENDSKNNQVIIYGGGYGHGVGMSQNGVKIMTNLGYSTEEILKHYYTNIELKSIY